jgi:hypothetical protein
MKIYCAKLKVQRRKIASDYHADEYAAISKHKKLMKVK